MNKFFTKEHKILITLGLSLILAIFLVTWANKELPTYRPLIQDMRLVDSVEISDVLDQQGIQYYADVKSHMLYVNQEQSELARISLAKIGIVIDYPEIMKHSDLNKAYDELLKQKKESEITGPIWQTAWFFKFIKLFMSLLVILVLIFAVVRPALKEIILDEDEQ